MKEIKSIKLKKCHLCGSEPDVKYSEGGTCVIQCARGHIGVGGGGSPEATAYWWNKMNEEIEE